MEELVCSLCSYVGSLAVQINNEEDHGPFGQEHHALDEFADSCFAKIVSGFDTLSEIIRQTDAQHHTQIVGMEVVAWSDHWTDGNNAHWKKAHEKFDDITQDVTDEILAAEQNVAVIASASQQQPNADDILLQEAPKHVEPVYHKTLGQVQKMIEERDSHHQTHYNHHAARHKVDYHDTHMHPPKQEQWVHE